MTWKIEPASRCFDAAQGDWDRLNQTLYRGNPFYDGKFVSGLLRHFGKGDEYLCTHRDGGQVDAMLLVRRGRLGGYGLFAPSQAQILPVFGHRLELIQDLLPRLPAVALTLDLINQDPDYSNFARLPDSGRLRNQDEALTIAIEVSGGFDQYWQQRSKNLRSNIRRYLNRAAGAGMPLRMESFTRPEDMPQAVARYAKLESAGWKSKTGTQISVDNAQGRFYAEVMRGFAENGRATVYELYLGERLAASRLCVSSAEMMIILKTTYDEELSDYAVGRLLLYRILEQVFATRSVPRIEFYTNATTDQIAWSTHQRTIRHVTLYRYGWLGALHRRLLARRAPANP